MSHRRVVEIPEAKFTCTKNAETKVPEFPDGFPESCKDDVQQVLKWPNVASVIVFDIKIQDPLGGERYKSRAGAYRDTSGIVSIIEHDGKNYESVCSELRRTFTASRVAQ